MLERPEGPLSPASARDESRVVVRVYVGPESAGQVVFSHGTGHVPMQVRTIKGRDVELVGGTFLPRQCHVEIEPSSGERADASRGKSAGARLKGVVRKVQTTSPEPVHSIWVQLESADPALLGAVQASLGSVRPEAGVGSATSAGVLMRRASQEGREGNVAARALDLGVPFVDPRSFEIQLSNAAFIPEELAVKHRLFPLFQLGGTITLGMDNPGDLAVIDQVRLRTGCSVEPCLCAAPALEALLARTYRAAEETKHPAQAADGEGDATSAAELERTTNPIVRLVRSLVEESARDGASDIHIEPERDFSRVRLRVDGILHERSTHPLEQHAPVVSRIKVMAKLDISETRRPQDGHFSLKLDQRALDVRVSTIPTIHGENVVLRLLVSDGKTAGLNELGLPQRALRRVEEVLEHPNGMILVTGPTGSGKTTTLYAALARLNTIERNVVTIEDPVEKRLPLLRQTQVNPKAGITFAGGLRSILRQDPDVIMVGEIRDQETAEIAVQAALTGHLVLSTLHTNSAAGALVRLSEMGIAPFMITSSLRAVISQRLIRRICPECRASVVPDARLVAGLGFEQPETIAFKAGSGCGRCLHTGYKGRIGIYEMLEISPALGRALLGGASRDEIEKEGSRALVCELREDGLRKVREGLTTVEEVARIVGLQQVPASADQGA